MSVVITGATRSTRLVCEDRSEAACLHRRDLGKTNMTRAHGRCPRGERLVAKAPSGDGEPHVPAALRCHGLTAPCVIDGPNNGVSFRAYVERVLVPVLATGDIIVMDNRGSHKGRAIAAHPRGQSQAFLPARLLARPQSKRAGLRQNEDAAAQGGRTKHRRHLENHRRPARQLNPERLRKLD